MKNILVLVIVLMFTVGCQLRTIYDEQWATDGGINGTQVSTAGGNVNGAQGTGAGGNVNGAQGTGTGGNVNGAQGTGAGGNMNGTQGTLGGGVNGAQGATGGVNGAQGTAGGVNGTQGAAGGVNGAQGTVGGGVNGAQGTGTGGNVNGTQGTAGGGVNGAQGTGAGGNVNGTQGKVGGNVNGTQGTAGKDGFVKDDQVSSGKRKWTFIIYMAADNDLESAAIADLNELEAVNYGAAPVSILALVDRHSGYDMTNGNWSDTRLFEIKSDPNGLTPTIRSSRIDCPELGLSKDSETELNTADPMVLSGLINFAKRAYPAEQYALFIWGHGTGWRGGNNNNSLPEPIKAVAFDDSQGQYMSLPSFGRAVAGKGLSVIAFDTCYGALLEVAYQIRNAAELFVGSEGEIMSTGWDYTALFTGFLNKANLTISDLGNAIQNQFSNQYASVNKATISQIQLSRVNTLFLRFNDFTGAVAKAITTESARNMVLNQILNSVESHFSTSFPSDMYIDVFDFTKKTAAIRGSITSNPTQQNAILEAANKLEEALALAVPLSWAKNGTDKKIGIHVIPLRGIAVPAALHELAYVKGSIAIEKNAFVEDSQNWVPNVVPKNDSLLDKLFYWTY